MNEQEQKNKRIAWMVAAVFHGVILVALSFVNMMRNPPFPESEIVEFAMADFGTTLDGNGNLQPEFVGENNNTKSTDNIQASPVTNTTGSEQQIIEDPNSSVAVKSSEKKNPTKKEDPVATPAKEEPKPEGPKVNTKALYSGSAKGSSGGNSGGSDGDGEGVGDKGNPNGAPGGRGVLGGGNGSWALNGRNLVSAAKLPEITEEGIVAIRIRVNRQGKVVGVETILSQCTTTSETLFSLAKKAALQCEFDARSDVAPEQIGTMTFRFVLR